MWCIHVIRMHVWFLVYLILSYENKKLVVVLEKQLFIYMELSSILKLPISFSYLSRI